MRGQTIEKCYKLHGYPPGYKPKGKSGANANGNQASCNSVNGADKALATARAVLGDAPHATSVRSSCMFICVEGVSSMASDVVGTSAQTNPNFNATLMSDMPIDSCEPCALSDHTSFPSLPSESSTHDPLPSDSTILSDSIPTVVTNPSADPQPTRRSTRVHKAPVYLQDYACTSATALPSSVADYTRNDGEPRALLLRGSVEKKSKRDICFLQQQGSKQESSTQHQGKLQVNVAQRASQH
ncbi:hypothetical protein SO802_012681 [Lithocarpus litseifolius]|uniref:Uncharacterized protein n=1 Tax=Lithocarpus litseifolius TaxID=425828 RepID=A0AAW2D727_9ROSI